ncbi:MAG: hypothetical protein KBS66_07525 [Eubacterium sp.]|nr:hypothetical protein [Candidatus Colimonas fimequi]
MTYEEAIKEINEFLMDEYGCATLSNDFLKLAAEALEKQVPKKPLTPRQEQPKGGVLMYCHGDRWCPTCHRQILNYDLDSTSIRFARNRRVCDCGQKLDWSEEE